MQPMLQSPNHMEHSLLKSITSHKRLIHPWTFSFEAQLSSRVKNYGI
jgi:hypothetical protein